MSQLCLKFQTILKYSATHKPLCLLLQSLVFSLRYSAFLYLVLITDFSFKFCVIWLRFGVRILRGQFCTAASMPIALKRHSFFSQGYQGRCAARWSGDATYRIVTSDIRTCGRTLRMSLVLFKNLSFWFCAACSRI